jgi:hypothetical protein
MTRFPRRWHFAVAALLTEQTIQAAAVKAGVSERALRSWLKVPAFAADFKKRSKAVLNSATSKLASATMLATETLIDNLQATKPGDRIRAAVSILTAAIRTSELYDLAARLEELEKRSEQQQTTNGRMHY